MKVECVREQDVLDAVASRRWPERCDSELREHVSSCVICADVAEIAGPLAAERDVAWTEHDIPPSSIVWWRAQIRAREEARRTAERPIALVQGIALLALVGAVFVIAPAAVGWLSAVASSLGSAGAWIAPRAAEISRTVAPAIGSAVPLLVVGASVVLAPIVSLLYFALADD
jgi:hypothetical protein